MGRVKTDIVIPHRHSDFSPHLCLTLRSIEKNFPHRKVWLAGYKPPWVSDQVGYIPVLQGGGSWQNHLLIMSEVAHHEEVSERFWYFNDDFYVLRKLATPPVYYDGTLEERARKLRGIALGSYTKGAEATLELLQNAGFENPLNFDLHVPMPMDKTGLADSIGLILRSGKQFWPHLRSVYAAMVGLEAEEGKDVKIAGAFEGIPDNSVYLSSSPRAIQGQLGRELKELFPHPGKYEKNVRA